MKRPLKKFCVEFWNGEKKVDENVEARNQLAALIIAMDRNTDYEEWLDDSPEFKIVIKRMHCKE